jgi:hypothetical protein
MVGPKTLYLLALAEELSNKMDKTTISPDKRPNLNVQFEAQREFGRKFRSQLRRVHGELSGDLLMLKERQFDPKMRLLAEKVKDQINKILLGVRESNPHASGWEFVNYVLGRPARDIIDNLDFLAKHHVQATQPKTEFEIRSPLKIAEVNGFQHLKELAYETKNYMEQNPPLGVPTSSPPPAQQPNPMADPAFIAPPDALTKA